MRVPVAVAQVPGCWSVRRNVGTVLDVVGATAPGTVLALPEAVLSGYDDELSGLAGLDPAELAAAQDAGGQAGGRPCHLRDVASSRRPLVERGCLLPTGRPALDVPQGQPGHARARPAF